MISESKHAGAMPSKSPAMKLTSVKPLNMFSSQMDRSRQEVERVCLCVCGLGGLTVPLYSVSNPFPFVPDKVINPICH